MATRKASMAEIDRVRDLLAEARPYVRARPDDAARYVRRALRAIVRLEAQVPELGPIYPRLAANLDAGLHFARAAPGMLEGYIDGASYELLALQGRRRESIA